MSNTLLTAALPYANGPLHLGHILEYVLADILARHRKRDANARGERVLFVCADDQHGAAITLRAKAEGVLPEELVAGLRVQRLRDFEDFQIGFDFYHATHSPENQALCEEVYNRLKTAGFIRKATAEQLFDEEAGLFLADRFVKGSCPRCQALNQHGDHCESCGASYEALELVNPVSQITGSAPSRRSSERVLFALSHPLAQDAAQRWARCPGRLAPESLAKLEEWLGSPLLDWDISRDEPYFGFPIPGEPGKRFYVWLDAPLGYLAAARACLESQGEGELFDELIRPDSNWEIEHVVGKDILYFHAIFWPALLELSGLKTPKAVHAHGFLTAQGRKLSKSAGGAVSARDYLHAGLAPQWLRFYLFSKISSGSRDVDLCAVEFCAKVNGDLVGKFANLGSRLAPLAPNALVKAKACHPLRGAIEQASREARDGFDRLDFARAHRALFGLADLANRFVSDHKPWEIARDPAREAELSEVVGAALEAFECLARWLVLVVPDIGAKALGFLGTTDDGRDPASPIEPGRRLGVFEPLARRVAPADIEKLFGRQP